MPTARERLLELSALPSGNSARQHIVNTVSSVVLIPEQGDIIDTEIDQQILSVDIILNQIDEEIIDVSIGETIEEYKIEDNTDGDTIQEYC
jgi:hypothetical protein